ncbi:YggT family protein [Clostridium gasigenes]|uniref:YggT family protein n=1 Tax=Clostridium gasigenes TaxID=94869 RepID=UPI001C0D0751|nr:YggT family protein [Clostridium gasigenes]
MVETTILVEIILSYIPSVRDKSLFQLLKSFNFPILEPFRRLQQNLFGMNRIDFSPILAILFIGFIRKFIFKMLL